MMGLKCLAVAFVLCSALCTPLAGQHPQRRPTSVIDLFNQEAAASDPSGAGSNVYAIILWGLPEMSQEPARPEMAVGLPRTALVNSLIAEAETANTEKGAEAYSASLASLLVGECAGKKYLSKFSRRLATADLMARRGRQGWVSESAVVRAFNELMKQVAGPPPEQIQTDTSVVHHVRFSLYNTSPDLSSVTSHPDKCLPSEAVFLVWLLLVNNGAAGMPLPEPVEAPAPLKGYVMVLFSKGTDARWLLNRYLAARKRPQIVSLYEYLARTIGF